MDDDQLAIARVLAGTAEAFRSLVERHQSAVWTFAWNMLRNDADADDLVQEVFVAAYRNLAVFDGGRARFSTWLLTIARNRCCTMLKARGATAAADDVPDSTPPPEAAVMDGELWQQLDAALARLPVEQQSAFVLAEIQELPYSEIAAIEGVEIGTVKSRVSRAKARLREIFQIDVVRQPE
jgi:RNA polymerase sigma-70 factor (ECF subfamily)